MEERKRRRLTAKRKFEIYMEVKKEGAKIGEILRREGIHLNDLRVIEEQVERGAIGALKMKGPGRTIRKKVDPIEHDQLKQELREKEKALSDLLVEHSLLKKRDALESRARLTESSSETLENAKHSWKRLKKRIKEV